MKPWDDRKEIWLGNLFATLIGRGIDPVVVPDRWLENAYKNYISEAAAARMIALALQLEESA